VANEVGAYCTEPVLTFASVGSCDRTSGNKDRDVAVVGEDTNQTLATCISHAAVTDVGRHCLPRQQRELYDCRNSCGTFYVTSH